MPDNKKLFDFGTGSIDRDQWLRDIDSKLEEFISMYGSAANKHRTTLLRQAFQDLRNRIANGDMLNRTADGLYQFGSALNREDKHMLEAYQRALGFMGKLARTQIKAPTPLEEKKYGTTTLLLNWLKYLNPSGKFNEKAYWAEGDDASRIAEIKKFLEQEKNGLGAYTGYEGYKDRADLESRIQAFLDSPTERNLLRLGFDNRNWITKPTEETPEDLPKTEELLLAELLQAYLSQKRLLEGRRALDLALDADTYLGEDFNVGGYSYLFPHSDNPTAFMLSSSLELSNYFKDFGVNWRSLYETKEGANGIFRRNLARLFYKAPDGSYPYYDVIKKYFTPLLNGSFLLNNTREEHERLVFLRPNSNGFEFNVRAKGNPYEQLIPQLKEGGVLKLLQGNTFLKTSDQLLNELFSKRTEETEPKVSQKSNKSIQENSLFSNSETARIAATIADITSMGAAFVPGYGTAASAVLGLGSTATNFGADLADGSGLWNATKNAGFGLAADVMGLIPGLGGIGKGAKIARNLMWAVPKMILWVNTANGLANAGEIKNSIMKLTSPSSMSVQDWLNVSQALQIMTGHGRSIATKVKKAGMSKTTTTTEPEYYIYTNKGKQKVSDETFKKLRETRGTKARQDLTLELMGEGITLNQTRFAPWNTSTRFGAFKEVPGRTTVEVQNKHKGWFSDESLVQKAENANPSVDIRGILTRINPYRAYYSRRNQPVIPEKNYDKLSIFPADSPLNIHNTTPKVLPHPTGEKYAARPTEQPKAQPNPQLKKKHKRRKHEIGGILYALRNGGIIKAETGVKLKPGREKTWYNDVFSNYEGSILSRLQNLQGADLENSIKWLNEMQDQHANLYRDRGDFNTSTLYDQRVEAYQKAYSDGNGFILLPNGFNVGIAANYNDRYDFGDQKRTSGDRPTEFVNDGLYSAITDDRRVLGRTGDWTPELLSSFNEKLGKLGYIMDNKYSDGYYRIKPLDGAAQVSSPTNPNETVLQEMAALTKSVDSEGSRDTVVGTRFKDPFDPTLLSVAAKTLLGLRGNRDIYLNLLDEMPQAPLRDPIDRKLAIVGWQERIKNGQNELADLRRVQQKQQGADQQTNFATALETERVGRDIMDKAFMEDSGRQFDTAQKSWNLDNEDYLYNIKVGDDNRKAIADRARMMAQIRAAWRSGDNNILMGALADTSNWLLKKYQREQDVVNLAREQLLGTKELFIEYQLLQNPNYEALKTEYETTKDANRKAQIASEILKMKVEVLRKAPSAWALKIYSNFHTPWFGGGYKPVLEVKNGTKLEVAKLKARGRDNDRYVSMIKDLRQSRRRRRR